VKTARLQARENRISVEVDENASGVTVMQTGRGRYSSITVGRNYGMVAGSVVGGMVMSGGQMVVGDGVTVVDGRVVSGNATVIEAGSPVTVTAYLPAGSSVNASSPAGDIETTGRLTQVAYAAQSGDAHLDEVHNVNFSTSPATSRSPPSPVPACSTRCPVTSPCTVDPGPAPPPAPCPAMFETPAV
jgi:hypothetical protein